MVLTVSGLSLNGGRKGHKHYPWKQCNSQYMYASHMIPFAFSLSCGVHFTCWKAEVTLRVTTNNTRVFLKCTIYCSGEKMEEMKSKCFFLTLPQTGILVKQNSDRWGFSIWNKVLLPKCRLLLFSNQLLEEVGTSLKSPHLSINSSVSLKNDM